MKIGQSGRYMFSVLELERAQRSAEGAQLNSTHRIIVPKWLESVGGEDERPQAINRRGNLVTVCIYSQSLAGYAGAAVFFILYRMVPLFPIELQM